MLADDAYISTFDIEIPFKWRERKSAELTCFKKSN